jgi:hydrogenase maturation protease
MCSVAGRRPRSDLLVVGVGNPLRQDDGVGPLLVRRLQERFGPELHALELAELDVSLAAELASYEELLVLDAAVGSASRPYSLERLAEAPALSTPRGFASHSFDWGFLLGVTRELYGRAPRADLLAIHGADFGLGEGLSSVCQANAEAALGFLIDYCSEGRAPRGQIGANVPRGGGRR